VGRPRNQRTAGGGVLLPQGLIVRHPSDQQAPAKAGAFLWKALPAAN